MNIGRIIIGGIVAGIIYFVGDGIVHGALLHSHWVEILGPNADQSLHQPAFFGPYDLLKGILAVWIYAAVRPRFGSGPATAAIAGLVVWFACIPVPLLGLLPMRFFGAPFAALWMLYSLIPMVLGAIVGAWLYKEPA
jgi:hypothetical protein